VANNYTHFSEKLRVKTDEQKAWLENWLTCPFDLAADSGDSLLENKKFVDWCKERGAYPPDVSVWPTFQWKFFVDPPAGRYLWIYAESEQADQYHVAAMVQAYFKHFHIDAVFMMTWAETCSAPRIHEFSGGEFIVLPFGKSVQWSKPGMLFDKVLDKINKNKKKKDKGEKGKKGKKGEKDG